MVQPPWSFHSHMIAHSLKDRFVNKQVFIEGERERGTEISKTKKLDRKSRNGSFTSINNYNTPTLRSRVISRLFSFLVHRSCTVSFLSSIIGDILLFVTDIVIIFKRQDSRVSSTRDVRRSKSRLRHRTIKIVWSRLCFPDLTYCDEKDDYLRRYDSKAVL